MAPATPSGPPPRRTGPAEPQVLPIFPLPDVTFFPHTYLPLHVFEARYRAMVTDALARDRRLAVARLLPGYEPNYDGKPAVAAIAGAGEIVSWERLAGGRFNILLEGRWRVLIEREVPTDTLYRLVRVQPLGEGEPGADVEPLVARIRAASRALLTAVGKPLDLLDTALGADQPPGVVADRAAAVFLADTALRQELLETVAVGQRLARLAGALDGLVKGLRRPE